MTFSYKTNNMIEKLQQKLQNNSNISLGIILSSSVFFSLSSLTLDFGISFLLMKLLNLHITKSRIIKFGFIFRFHIAGQEKI